MLSVFRMEWKKRLQGISFYIIAALLTVFASFFTLCFNLQYGSPNFAEPLNAMGVVLCVLVPITAASVSVDRRRGGDRYLFTLPIRSGSLVAGTYFATLLSLLLPTALLALFPLFLGNLGTVALSSSYTALLGYGFLLADLLALNLFVSLLFPHPVPAAGTGTALSFLLFFSTRLSPIFATVSPFSKLLLLSYGRFHLAALLYGVAFALLFLLASVAVVCIRRQGAFLQKRSKKHRKNAVLPAAAALVLVLLLVLSNLLIYLLPSRVLAPDVSGIKTFLPSDRVTKQARSIQTKIHLSLLCSGGRREADENLFSYLEAIADASPNLTLSVLDPTESADLWDRYGSYPDNSVIIQSPLRTRILRNTDLYYYYNPATGVLTPEEYLSALAAFSSNDKTYEATYTMGGLLYQNGKNTLAYFYGDGQISAALSYVQATDVPEIGIWNESIDRTDVHFLTALKLSGAHLTEQDLTTDAPPACDTLLLLAPTRDLTADEKNNLSTFLSRGGRLFLTTDFSLGKLPNLAEVLSSYGIGYGDSVSLVAEADSDRLPLSTAPTVLAEPVLPHALTGTFAGSILLPNAHPIAVSAAEGVTVTEWIRSSPRSVLVDRTGATLSDSGSYPVGVIAETDRTKIVWVSSSDIFSALFNDYYAPLPITSNTLSGKLFYAPGGNYSFFLSAVFALNGAEALVSSVPATVVDTSTLSISVTGFLLWGILPCILLPAVILAFGIVRRYIRRRR